MPRALRYRRDLIDILRRARSSGHAAVLVAIGGGGGTGKSHLAGFIQDRLDDVTVIHADDFSRSGTPGWEAQRFREQVLGPLLQGQSTRYQAYDWDADRLAEWHQVNPRGVVVAEGVAVVNRAFADLWDVSVWVDCPRDIRLRRGIRRDGPAAERIWVEQWMPEEDSFFESEKPRELADYVVNGHEGAVIHADLAAHIIDVLERAGVEIVVDGGWGIDALVGRQTRSHDDLDVVVAMEVADRGREVLERNGFVLTLDERPVRMQFHDLDGHVVEFHTVAVDERGGWQAQPDGSQFLYSVEGMSATGTINGRMVRCVTPALQVLCHTGYERSSKDERDLEVLREAFGLASG